MVPKCGESKAEGGLSVKLGLSKICNENVTCHKSCYMVKEESRSGERDKLSYCKTGEYVTKDRALYTVG
jgi:hypothetical protein